MNLISKLEIEGDEFVDMKEAFEFQTKSPVEIGRFPTQKIVRAAKLNKLMTH
jgi:hypothetical protein